MTLQIGNEEIPFRIERSPGKKVDLRFSRDEPVLLIRTPEGEITPQARDFVAKHKNWIIRQFQRQKETALNRKSFWDNLNQGVVPLLGQLTPFQFIDAKSRFVKRAENGEILIHLKKNDPETLKRSFLFQALKALATNYLKKRTVELANQTGSEVNMIRVKGQKSKWGSCSGLKNINLNWHLIFLKKELVDYVIVHELMHLREMNHSPRFWAWVKKYYPDYKSAEAELKQKGWLIGIYES